MQINLIFLSAKLFQADISWLLIVLNSQTKILTDFYQSTRASIGKIRFYYEKQIRCRSIGLVKSIFDDNSLFISRLSHRIQQY